MTDTQEIITYEAQEEKDLRVEMHNLFSECPLPPDQTLSNLGLYLNSKNLSRILFMDYLYRQIVKVPGVIMEFGTRWGQNVALFAALRGIYDPFNRHRKIIAFDTFEGFPSIHAKDGGSPMMEEGMLNLTKDYEEYLKRIISNIEKDNPLSHINKFETRKGDASREIGCYLNEYPETIVSLAYFDFDLYEPTKACLEAIGPRLTQGSVVAFDELNDCDSPGETMAVMEVLGLNNIKLRRPEHTSRVSYFIVE